MDQELIQYLNGRFEEVKRHAGVLAEGLRYELQLVAENLTMHVEVRHVQEREYHDRQHQETRSRIREELNLERNRPN